MRGKAMQKIVYILEREWDIDFSKLNGLEFFSRKGNWQTLSYSDLVKTLTAWEIDEQFESSLRKNLPKAEVTIGDSFKLACEFRYKNRFDFIVFDNPQGTYNGYCEHFECVDLINKIIKKEGGVVIFNVNKNPFNYDKTSIWAQRRNHYYNVEESAGLDSVFLLSFYKHKFYTLGFKTLFSFEISRNNEYLSYLVFRIEPINLVLNNNEC
jgi:hypothetical protein